MSDRGLKWDDILFEIHNLKKKKRHEEDDPTEESDDKVILKFILKLNVLEMFPPLGLNSYLKFSVYQEDGTVV